MRLAPNAPAIRASFLRDNVEALVRLGAVDQNAVLRKVDSVTDALETSVKVDWLDVGLDVELSEATFRVVGAARVRQLNRELMASIISGPLLGPLHKTALTLLGSDPDKLFKWVPKGWNAVFRSVGEPRWDEANHTFVVDQLPAVAMSAAWLEGVAGAMEGLALVFGAKQPGAALTRDVENRRAELTLSWKL